MNVDMATYKAEFLSHYYEGRLRPRHAYAMGLIYWWARLASLAPGLVNFVTHAAGRRHGCSRCWAGSPRSGKMPAFAPETFKAWWRRRAPRNQGGPRVVLWPDTFNNHFHPADGQGGRRGAGGRRLPGRRPADVALLRPAALRLRHARHGQGLLREILDTLRPEIEAGTPVVGLEPSCVAVFRDELMNLFPMDEDAKRLSQQTFILSEFLEKKAPDYRCRSSSARPWCRSTAITNTS